MANAPWPASLPAYVLERGYSEKLAEQSIETPMEAGRPKVRRRFTATYKQFGCSMKMTQAQAATFEDFYGNTLAGGSLRFDWLHPRTRAAATFRFRLPAPQFSVEGEAVIAQFALEQVA